MKKGGRAFFTGCLVPASDAEDSFSFHNRPDSYQDNGGEDFQSVVLPAKSHDTAGPGRTPVYPKVLAGFGRVCLVGCTSGAILLLCND